MECKQCKSSFDITKADTLVHKKMNVPAPTLCPDCRQQRRIAFRNDQNYYKGVCHICKKNLITVYSPDKNIPVLCNECFWSDRFNPLEYGQDFDFSRPFFEQFAEMKAKAPRLAIYNTQSENAEFTIHSSRNRNCYMGSSLVDCEDVHYSDWAFNCRDCVDMLFCTRMEMCYECVDSQDCARSNHLELCSNVTESFFCFDCRGCQNVAGCVSLRNRKNHILNQPASKEEFKEVAGKLKTNPKFFAEFKQKYEELKLGMPKRDAWTYNTENCSGNYITDSKNTHHSYEVKNIEDGRYAYEAKDVKDGYDVTRIGGGEFIYEVKGAVDLQFSKFCNLTYQSDNMAYCDNTQASSYCFGCMSGKQNKHCLLNKQYTSDEYRKIVPKLIEHMKKTGEYGEFFPITLSPFGYNETKAQEFYPMKKEEVLKNGWQWCDYEPPAPETAKTIPARRLPDNIKDTPDDILNWAIESDGNGKPFKIIQQELKFYRLKGLPIPHFSYKERHQKRVALQNPRKLYGRKCHECQKPIQTTYAPEKPEQVYCEECFLKRVY
jgi:hypothetical protein